MSGPTFRAVPILRMFDFAQAKEFCLDFLGFRSDWEHRFEDGAPVCMQIARGDLVLHLNQQHGDCCPGAAVYAQDASYRSAAGARGQALPVHASGHRAQPAVAVA